MGLLRRSVAATRWFAVASCLVSAAPIVGLWWRVEVEFDLYRGMNMLPPDTPQHLLYVTLLTIPAVSAIAAIGGLSGAPAAAHAIAPAIPCCVGTAMSAIVLLFMPEHDAGAVIGPALTTSAAVLALAGYASARAGRSLQTASIHDRQGPKPGIALKIGVLAGLAAAATIAAFGIGHSYQYDGWRHYVPESASVGGAAIACALMARGIFGSASPFKDAASIALPGAALVMILWAPFAESVFTYRGCRRTTHYESLWFLALAIYPGFILALLLTRSIALPRKE